ncbi:MAG: hypothetical protein ACPGRV_01490, partial [Candidatus Thalassarchaeaceae archaeon]
DVPLEYFERLILTGNGLIIESEAHQVTVIGAGGEERSWQVQRRILRVASRGARTTMKPIFV